MKSILNIVGGVSLVIGAILLASQILTPCGKGFGQCGDRYVPHIGLALVVVGIIAVSRGSKK